MECLPWNRPLSLFHQTLLFQILEKMNGMICLSNRASQWQNLTHRTLCLWNSACAVGHSSVGAFAVSSQGHPRETQTMELVQAYPVLGGTFFFSHRLKCSCDVASLSACEPPHAFSISQTCLPLWATWGHFIQPVPPHPPHSYSGLVLFFSGKSSQMSPARPGCWSCAPIMNTSSWCSWCPYDVTNGQFFLLGHLCEGGSWMVLFSGTFPEPDGE